MFTYKIDHELELALPRPELDAEAIYQLVEKNRTEFAKWLPWASNIKSPKDEEKFLKDCLQKYGKGEMLLTIIWYNHKPVGTLTLNRFHASDKSTEIGYWLDKDASGKGIMHRTVLALCDIAFTDYDIDKVEIHASVKNDSSNNVAKKAGFHFDGIHRAGELLRDGFHDSTIWSLLRDEWQNKKAR
ncbi:GNAT family N-acetyltransferase [Holzapfeliella floricola]|uniref:Acetyltransferase n=1 Tax=Holzapfeliella floricola DSM 23037 = JCM 16512 TaxID=1423744 RepID=A0A0R2DW93_9LACO|nr:GNAT family protein [Holzapfeliella floricola]KRN04842.1 acetyltransferase [Holzapfeliella floricola DSM 23037 = JCM 16512]